MKYSLLLVLLLMNTSAPALSHGGGLAADGCHKDRKNGGRHCHRQKSEMCGNKLCFGSESKSRRSSSSPYIPRLTPLELPTTTRSTLPSPEENMTSKELCVNYIIVGTQKECI